ncbi:MAG TPA: LysR family transcriptional regulator, partial [Desulfobulbus sp.]|nr:LysR family transcriptional regulator [Desulfobulbus sp.]
GIKLLDRLGRQVEPTPAGRLFYRHGSTILADTQRAVEAMEQFSGRIAGRLLIGSSTIPGTYILPDLIGRFHQRYPAVRTTLLINGSRTIAQKVLAGELELGLVGAKWNESGLEWKEIFADELVLAVRAGHPLAVRETVTLEDVVKEPFILREQESGTRKVFAEVLKAHGLTENDLHEVAEIGSTAAIKEAVKAGIGVSILSSRALRDGIACKTIAGIKLQNADLYRHFYMISRKNRELSPVTAVFMEYLHKKAAFPVLDAGSG